MSCDMTLVVFDIDGTLTQTNQADGECFVRALEEVFGFRDVDSDWSIYKHTTDSGILHEIYEGRSGRLPATTEIECFRDRFVELLEATGARTAFAPIEGAVHLLECLSKSDHYRIALATGAWSASARVKMSGAGLSYDKFPAASSDDAMDRESIIRIAAQRAAERYGASERCVYIGDGVWDARACRTLGIPLIGIGEGAKADRLAHEGAVQVFANYVDVGGWMQCLHNLEGDLYRKERSALANKTCSVVPAGT